MDKQYIQETWNRICELNRFKSQEWLEERKSTFVEIFDKTVEELGQPEHEDFIYVVYMRCYNKFNETQVPMNPNIYNLVY